ncbi:MAG: response regulator transcription factor [Chloroflexi bacterium]|nr:response regulator transcription factor [Chloroflexota bacterium]
MELIHLLVVADDPLVRAGLATLLTVEADCDVVGQLSSQDIFEDDWESDLSSAAPDVIIWDLGWELPQNLPNWQEISIPIVALLPDGEDTTQIWITGVQGLLYRDTVVTSLIVSARAAVQGLVTLDPHLADLLLPTPEELLTADTTVDPLTNRENEVLQLVAEGLTNKAIARQLHISDHTVKFHVNAIMTKLNAQSRTEAVVRATRLGLILL